MNKPVENKKWRCASMHDPNGRRGVWFKVEDDVLIVCGGREGNDAWSEIPRSSLPVNVFDALVAALQSGAWMQETHGPNTDLIPSQ